MQTESKNCAVWPSSYNPLNPGEIHSIHSRISEAVNSGISKMQLTGLPETALESLYIPLAAWIVQHKPADRPLVLGINGAQGSGKSTLCELLRLILSAGFDQRVAGFSIDDIYLTRKKRQQLAESIHPLLITRGVPGTHEVTLGIQVINDLMQAQENSSTAIPAFNKAIDDRVPAQEWSAFSGRPDIIIFEGWCVGCIPQQPSEISAAINSLEQNEDPDSTWRQYVNDQLSGPYQELYSLIDLLLMLKIPSMECVLEWRSLQEQKLAAQTKTNTGHLMDEAALQRFIMHYERLTRHCLDEMPERANATLFLNHAHQIEQVNIND